MSGKEGRMVKMLTITEMKNAELAAKQLRDKIWKKYHDDRTLEIVGRNPQMEHGLDTDTFVRIIQDVKDGKEVPFEDVYYCYGIDMKAFREAVTYFLTSNDVNEQERLNMANYIIVHRDEFSAIDYKKSICKAITMTKVVRADYNAEELEFLLDNQEQNWVEQTDCEVLYEIMKALEPYKTGDGTPGGWFAYQYTINGKGYPLINSREWGYNHDEDWYLYDEFPLLFNINTLTRLPDIFSINSVEIMQYKINLFDKTLQQIESVSEDGSYDGDLSSYLEDVAYSIHYAFGCHTAGKLDKARKDFFSSDREYALTRYEASSTVRFNVHRDEIMRVINKMIISNWDRMNWDLFINRMLGDDDRTNTVSLREICDFIGFDDVIKTRILLNRINI